MDNIMLSEERKKEILLELKENRERQDLDLFSKWYQALLEEERRFILADMIKNR